MENYKPSDEHWIKEYELEVEMFEQMSGAQEIQFLNLSDDDRTTNEYVRIICILGMIGYEKITAKLVEDAGKDKINEVCRQMEACVINNRSIIRKWAKDYIKNIKIPRLKALVKERWHDIKPLKIPKEDVLVTGTIGRIMRLIKG